MEVETLADTYFEEAPEELIEELFGWHDNASEGDSPLSADDFVSWWKRLTENVDGDVPRSMRVDISAVFGEIARLADHNGRQSGHDDLGIPSTSAREVLLSCGLAPHGLWPAELLLDRCDALIRIESRVADVSLEDDEAVASDNFRGDYETLLTDAIALADASSSVPASRCCTAVVTWCSFRLGNHHGVLAHADRYFALEHQAAQESKARPHETELHLVATAAVGSAAALGDRGAIDEVMRQVRLRVESDGSLSPTFAGAWARGLRQLDPHYGQMIAHRLVLDVEELDLGDEDIGYWSSFLLFEMSMASGDLQLAQTLATEWVPRALDADHGPGAQLWIEIIDVDGHDDR